MREMVSKKVDLARRCQMMVDVLEKRYRGMAHGTCSFRIAGTG